MQSLNNGSKVFQRQKEKNVAISLLKLAVFYHERNLNQAILICKMNGFREALRVCVCVSQFHQIEIFVFNKINFYKRSFLCN